MCRSPGAPRDAQPSTKGPGPAHPSPSGGRFAWRGRMASGLAIYAAGKRWPGVHGCGAECGPPKSTKHHISVIAFQIVLLMLYIDVWKTSYLPVTCISGTAAVTKSQVTKFQLRNQDWQPQDGSQSKNKGTMQATKHIPTCHIAILPEVFRTNSHCWSLNLIVAVPNQPWTLWTCHRMETPQPSKVTPEPLKRGLEPLKKEMETVKMERNRYNRIWNR